MKLVMKNGYCFAVPEIDEESVLCQWLESDIQNEDFVIEDAERLVKGGYIRRFPLIGNRYTAFFEDGDIFIAPSKIEDADTENYERYGPDQVDKLLSQWKDFILKHR